MAKKLEDFLIALSQDATLRRAYDSDAAVAASQYGLSKKHVTLLLQGDSKKIKAGMTIKPLKTPGEIIDSPKAPAKTVKAPAKTIKAPAKTVKAPPAKTMKAPARAPATIKAPKVPAATVKAPRKPAKTVKASTKPKK